jgi:hypothetical protein
MPDTRVRVDFNDIRHGRLRALTRNADDPSAVALGARVELWDDDGNAAEGRVVELADRGLVWLELVRGTWRDAVDPPRHYPTMTIWTEGHVEVLYLVTLRARRHEDIEQPYNVSSVAGTAPTTFWEPRQLIDR